MIETDQQRRWWFATHPEYSASRTGQRRNPRGYENSRHRKEEPGGTTGEYWWSQQPFGRPAADRDFYDEYKDLLESIERVLAENPAKEAFLREMMSAGWSRQRAEERWQVYKLNESVARGVATAMTVHGAIGAARAMLTGAYRWAVSLGEVGAIGRSKGPGQWVEVQRSLRGLEHQSKMSGQPIIERDGKYYIKEYAVPSPTKTRPVYVDDFRDGKLYEYKGPQGNLVKKRTNEFYEFIDKLPDDALRQAKAAQGIPVIWRVGAEQVKVFEKAVGKVPGVIIIP